MSEYIPDRWVVLEFFSEVGGKIRKVFSGNYGGFAGSDSWKLNSGITKVEEFDNRYEFHGETGSVYICMKRSYGMSLYMMGVLQGWRNSPEYGSMFTVSIVEGYDNE